MTCSVIAAAAVLWKKQHQTEGLVNGRMNELLEVTRQLARHQGIEVGEERHERKS